MRRLLYLYTFNTLVNDFDVRQGITRNQAMNPNPDVETDHHSQSHVTEK